MLLIKKLKFTIVVCILLSVAARSHCQDSLTHDKVKAIVSEFAENSHQFISLDSLPQFVVNYIEKRNGEKFSVSKRKFKATDVGSGPRRRLSFLAKLKDDYILSYEHGGIGYHGHSIIFETNGGEVTNVYNIITYDNIKKLSELMDIVKSKRYWLRDEHL